MIISPVRSDSYGHGEYLAPRGSRKHQGYDFKCDSNEPYFSDASGEVIRIGYPYARFGLKSEYRLIEIKHDSQTKIKYMYVDPCVSAGDRIDRGEVIGYVQDLTTIYPKTETREAIQNHVHFEVWIEGCHVNPIAWLKMRGWA